MEVAEAAAGVLRGVGAQEEVRATTDNGATRAVLAELIYHARARK